MKTEIVAARLDTALRFFLCLLVFWLPYSPAAVETCVILSTVLWIVKRTFLWQKKRKSGLPFKGKCLELIGAFAPAKSILNRPIAFFLAVCLLSVLSSVFWAQAMYGFFTKTLEWFVIYFLVCEAIKEKRHVALVLGVFLFSAAAVLADGIWQFHVTGRDIFFNRLVTVGGVTGPFKHANSFGGYLTVVLPVIFSFLFFRKIRRWRLLIMLAVFVSLWVGVITFSRGAWIGIVAGLLLFLFLAQRKVFLTFLLALGVVLFSFYLFSPVARGTISKFSTYEMTETSRQRLGLWQDSLRMIEDKPVFGHGLNSYMKIFQAYRRETYEFPTYAHNCYVQMAAEIGLAGLACFLGIMVTLFKQIFSNFVSTISKKEDLSFLLLGYLSGILAFLIHSFVDTNFYSLQLVALFWFTVGMAVVIDKILNNPSNRAIRIP